ncbi:hypothetical protein ACVGOW_23730 [Pseudonocardia saturnea]
MTTLSQRPAGAIGGMESVAEGPGSARRRLRAESRRRRQVVVRFSEAELVLVRDRAAGAGLAVGAWIGETVLGVAARGAENPVGLLDLVRLHADVVAIERATRATCTRPGDVAEMLVRLDVAIDAVVAASDRARR